MSMRLLLLQLGWHSNRVLHRGLGVRRARGRRRRPSAGRGAEQPLSALPLCCAPLATILAFFPTGSAARRQAARATATASLKVVETGSLEVLAVQRLVGVETRH